MHPPERRVHPHDASVLAKGDADLDHRRLLEATGSKEGAAIKNEK
jgi:hypothetical protein